MIRHTIPNTPKLHEIEKQVDMILKSGWVTNHVFCEQFENEVKKFLKVKHVVAVNSCTSGLMLGIKALKLQDHSRIGMPAFTFNATGHAAMWNKHNPFFVDVDRETHVLDSVPNIRKDKIDAICGVDVFGNPCNKKQLQDEADDAGVPVYYDSAHAFGSVYDGKNVGNFGEFEVFSLAPTKIMFAAEGGIVATNNEEIAEFVRAGRVYGHFGDYNCKFNGLSARFPEFNAILGLHTLRNIKKNLKRREEIVRIYKENLSEVPEISFQKMNGNPVSNNYFGILIEKGNHKSSRDFVYDYLVKANDIEVKKYFDPCLHWMDVFKNLPTSGNLENCEYIAKQNLTLPIYEKLNDGTVDKICRKIKECFK